MNLIGKGDQTEQIIKEQRTVSSFQDARFATWPRPALKTRDRQSYSFALVSVAAGLELDGATIRSAGLALGGVAHKPWRFTRG
jgi:hypothetical protein